MIRLFDRNETNFNHNKNILTPLSCYVNEESNGMFELEIELPKTILISNGDIIKAPTPRGEQLFRVYRSIKTLKNKKVYAKHFFYDLSKNFIIDVNLSGVSCITALQSVLSNTETPHNFIGTSDIADLNTVSYTRLNPILAIMGNENSILNLYGGNLIRNNYNIQIKASGLDRGYDIRMGKNLVGIEDDSDESSLKTRIYPTVELDGSIITLPEKYVDSPLINNYGDPIIYEEKITLSDEQKELTTEEIYTIMRNHCAELFSKYNVDKPIVNYKIDFVELSKTEQYKDFAILEQLDLYDIVSCYIPSLDINVKASVIKYKYDCLKNRYDSIELGSFKSVSNYQTNNIVKQLQKKIQANQTAIDYATNVITGNKGGYIVTRTYPNGKPYELLVMETEDINTPNQNVIRLNKSGLGFSNGNGYNGPFGTAITIDGHINASYIDVGELTSILLKSDNYVANVSGTKINLVDGTIDTKNFKLASDGTVTIGGYATTLDLNTVATTASNASSVATSLYNGLQNGTTTINGGCITTGSINANFVTGGTLTGVVINSVGTDANLTIENGNILINGYNGYLRGYANGGYCKLIGISSLGNIVIGHDDADMYPSVYGGTRRNINMYKSNLTIKADSSGNDAYVYVTGGLYVNDYQVVTTATSGGLSVGYASTAGYANGVNASSWLGSFAISSGGGYISYNGASKDNSSGYVYIGAQTLQAGTIQQISIREAKDNIVSYDKSGLDLICNTPIRNYTLRDNLEDTKTHVGVIIDEAPDDIVGSGGKTVSLYDMISVSWKAIQEQQQLILNQTDQINELKERLSKLEVA